MVDNRNEYLKMYKVEKNHWWYKSLHNLVLNVIKEQFKTNNISVLDAGCGTGGLLRFLKANEYKRLRGFDISSDAVTIASSENYIVEVKDLKDYKYNNELYDVIVSNDTMYFFNLKEQQEILDVFYKSLNSGGIIILNLPSFSFFRGTHDKAVGIKKRFSKAMISDMIDFTQFDIVQKRYWPFLLSPLIFFIRFFQRLRFYLNKNMKIDSDIDVPDNFINKLLYRIVSFENTVFNEKPFGSSLFLVLKKKEKYVS